MDKRTRNIWLLGSSAFFLFGVVQLVREIREPSEGLLGPVVMLAFASGFVAIGLLDWIPRTPAAAGQRLTRLRRYVEPRVPILFLWLFLLFFGLMLLTAVLSGSMAVAFVLLLVVVAIVNILDEYRRHQMVAPLLTGHDDETRGPKKRQTTTAVLKRVESKLRRVDVLRGQRYSLISIRPSETPRAGAAEQRPTLDVAVELHDRRDYVQMLLCLAAWFAATMLFWCAWFVAGEGALLADRSAKIAFGFSILVPPALLIALALKLTLPKTLAIGAATMAVHVGLLTSPGANAESDVVRLVQGELPIVVASWLLGTAALLAIERLSSLVLGQRTIVRIDAPD